jgi:hypothetical protein
MKTSLTLRLCALDCNSISLAANLASALKPISGYFVDAFAHNGPFLFAKTALIGETYAGVVRPEMAHIRLFACMGGFVVIVIRNGSAILLRVSVDGFVGRGILPFMRFQVLAVVRIELFAPV